MRFVDDIYSLYREQLEDDEENAISVVLNILEDQTRQDMMTLIEGMEDEEVIQMVGVYLVEMLKMKMAQDDNMDEESFIHRPRYH
ncbi:DUF6154 family protein [Desmospora profundinema]|uniref:Cytosolic protein n=1 Tax=Desmospora profundinema TaxID=1571184 RepID=A0ABU1IN02_9BACL|nr:DUF6154 family protein [Desmospora profundinema]MDR6226118.1 hypothetical protein [Desmospora profundinema]